jgi:endonuclease/exonuclease/phosphatase family metal-dependent hydrolase
MTCRPRIAGRIGTSLRGSSMRISAWNIAHQTRKKRIPRAAIDALVALAPDVLVLTEYVPGPDHARAVADLREAGFTNIHITDRVERQNQVLLATRSPSHVGDTTPPSSRHQVPPNLLHAVIDTPRLHVIGLRIPMFVRGDTQGEHEYREWLRAQAPTWGRQPTVVIGDLNADPAIARSWRARLLASYADDGWSIASPAHGWSFMGKRGHTARIDHALLSPGLTARDAQYVTEAGECVFAGRDGAVSDHAVLVVEIELPDP